MSTLQEIKPAIASLPQDEQFELWKWLSESRAVRQFNEEEFRREVQLGLEDLERGRYLQLKDDQALREYMDGVKARGRARLAQNSKAA